jgi:phosphatidylinositol glycan class K
LPFRSLQHHKFFKFQDEEELTAQDISNMLQKMYDLGLYKQIVFVADTCQAFTLFDKVTAPNVLTLGTSLKNENAYAHHCTYWIRVILMISFYCCHFMYLTRIFSSYHA